MVKIPSFFKITIIIITEYNSIEFGKVQLVQKQKISVRVSSRVRACGEVNEEMTLSVEN